MNEPDVERLCELMHNAYEAAAVAVGWETQAASRKPWADVPEANKATMRAAVGAVVAEVRAALAAEPAEDCTGCGKPLAAHVRRDGLLSCHPPTAGASPVVSTPAEPTCGHAHWYAPDKTTGVLFCLQCDDLAAGATGSTTEPAPCQCSNEYGHVPEPTDQPHARVGCQLRDACECEECGRLWDDPIHHQQRSEAHGADDGS